MKRHLKHILLAMVIGGAVPLPYFFFKGVIAHQQELEQEKRRFIEENQGLARVVEVHIEDGGAFSVLVEGAKTNAHYPGSKAGHPKLTMELLVKKFWRKVNVSGENDCWMWTGMTYKGYGKLFRALNYPKAAHRFSMSLHIGRPVKPEEYVLHHCDNPGCVNPKHLFIGTQKDNMQDCVKKGRKKPNGLHGDTHPRSRLSKELSVKIKEIYEYHTVPELARMFNVSTSTIKRVLHGWHWSCQ